MFLALIAASVSPVAASQRTAVVAAAVETEFPSHDLDGDGKLSRTEFDTWMVQLRTRRDPHPRATARADRAWADKAFAQADRDRNAGVTAAELTDFLTQSRS
ncbi:hypothetical protein [uncultured Sphingomonas sp.]|uniref:hypothetical protein n=1 Tax=uncultured Sphingomonas sp. TaxID=158754 RepID=UPI0035CA0CF6